MPINNRIYFFGADKTTLDFQGINKKILSKLRFISPLISNIELSKDSIKNIITYLINANGKTIVPTGSKILKTINRKYEKIVEYELNNKKYKIIVPKDSNNNDDFQKELTILSNCLNYSNFSSHITWTTNAGPGFIIHGVKSKSDISNYISELEYWMQNNGDWL
jgi:hypothetical protein